MIIERNVVPFVVHGEDPVLRALEKITDNRSRIIFCISEHGHLLGAITDGDVRRWLAGQEHVDLSRPCVEAANPVPRTASVTATPAQIRPLFTPVVDHVPLVDERGRLVAVAVNRRDGFRIGHHEVGRGSPVLLVAEIGNNHNGSVDLAKRLVDEAADAGADIVKFQLRDLAALYRNTGADPAAGEDLGPQYTLDLLTRFNLPPDRLFTVFDHARERGIDVMCTPWDLPSVDALVDYGIPAMKIASADLTNHALLAYAAAPGVPLVVSTGMSTEAEIVDAVEVLRASGTAYALLHCQSTYPAPFKDVNLRYLARLAQLGGCPVGYSGHERGIHVPLAAVGLGATIIEKHLTVDKGLEGNDHTVSLLPAEFAELVRRVREVEEALGTTQPRTVSTGEQMNRVNLAKSLVAARPITAGEVITEDAVEIRSPGRGLQPNALARLVGRTANRPLGTGDFFYATDLTDASPAGRAYSFRRPWGLPVRYHDLAAMTRDVHPDFVEFHFSYMDLDLDPEPFFADLPDRLLRDDGRLPMTLTTHLPDLFAGDFIVDLAAADDDVWERSIAEVQRTIGITRALTRWFTVEQDPVMVLTMGGFTHDRHLPATEREAGYARIARALARLDASGVRLTAQTLPPFPWLLGGQRYHNLFMDPADTAEFARAHDVRLTLDVSHTRLAATFLGIPLADAVALLAPWTEHLHLVDGVGVDGEGVQVGEGDVDWPELARQLDDLAPDAGFIPEIWQGHVDGGAGFWTALERLEQWF